MSKQITISRQANRKFSDDFKIEIVNRYLEGEESYRTLSKKTGVGKTQICNWVRIFAEEINANPSEDMKTNKPTVDVAVTTTGQSLQAEIDKLRKKLEQTRKELTFERMRATAYDRMIDLAENRWKIEIRKKSGAKQ